MRALGLGRVVQWRSSQYHEGDLVQGITGWQDYLVLHEDAKGYVRLPADPGIPLPTLLGACGMSGVTAYYGLTDIAPVQPGETLVVSAAAGAVGSIAGQIGKIMGAVWLAAPAAPTSAATSLTNSASTLPSITRLRTSSSSSRRPRPMACTSTAKTWAAR